MENRAAAWGSLAFELPALGFHAIILVRLLYPGKVLCRQRMERTNVMAETILTIAVIAIVVILLVSGRGGG